MTYRETWFEFHHNLMGFKLTRKGMPIEKFMVYWSGWTSDDCIVGRKGIKLA